jgi:hypothetical protein
VSYRIEITAASLEELADKALALGGRLVVVHTSAASSQVRAEVAKVAPSPEPEADTSTSTASETTEQPSPQPIETPPPASASASDVPDFDTVVTPLVLKLVEVKGKPAAQEVLGRFGVIKASQLSSERWQELVDAINDELAA